MLHPCRQPGICQWCGQLHPVQQHPMQQHPLQQHPLSNYGQNQPSHQPQGQYHGPTQGHNPTGNTSSNIRCHNCHLFGHYACQCPHPPAQPSPAQADQAWRCGACQNCTRYGPATRFCKGWNRRNPNAPATDSKRRSSTPYPDRSPSRGRQDDPRIRQHLQIPSDAQFEQSLERSHE